MLENAVFEKLKLFIFYFLFQSIQSLDSDVVFVFEHVRHGARSPLFYDGNKLYKDHFGTQWEGAAVLTNVGRRTHYVLGIQNRKKYGHLLNLSKYDPKEIEVYSTNSGRTIESIQAELHAMYLPGTLETLSKAELDVAIPPMNDDLLSEISDDISQLNNSTIINDINLFSIQMSSPKN